MKVKASNKKIASKKPSNNAMKVEAGMAVNDPKITKYHDDSEVEMGHGAEADESMESPKDHEVEMAVEDMLRAHKHKSNPKMMEAVHAKLSDKKKAIESIQDIKMARNEMFKAKGQA
jgi:hypothetical protein